jgi:hypothetical protein
MEKPLIYISVILFAMFSIISCTKVVNINLNDSAPKIIIEGTISDQPSSCYVKISRTVNYNEPNIFPAVTGSLVIISDNLGNKVTLKETTPGIYFAQSFKGFAGRTYTLSVNTEGTNYTAISKMPDPVRIDSMSQGSFTRGNFGGGGIIKFVRIQYRDPIGEENFYRFIEKINSKVNSAIFLDNDKLRDGNLISQQIVLVEGGPKSGDSVTISLQTIDKNVFNYLAQLDQITNGYGGPMATPANPVSNFNNGALGYFSACAVRSGLIIIR